MKASKLNYDQVTALTYLKKVAKIISERICKIHGLEPTEINVYKYIIWFIKVYKKNWNDEQVFVIQKKDGQKSYYLVPFGSLISCENGEANFYYNDQLLGVNPINEIEALEAKPSRKKWKVIILEDYINSIYAKIE